MSKLTELEMRKRLLVAQSDMYRQQFLFEAQNLQACCTRWQRALSWVGALRTVITFLPLLSSLVGLRAARPEPRKRASRWRQILGSAIAGWRLYQRFGPLFQNIFKTRHSESEAAPRRESGRPLSQ